MVHSTRRPGGAGGAGGGRIPLRRVDDGGPAARSGGQSAGAASDRVRRRVPHRGAAADGPRIRPHDPDGRRLAFPDVFGGTVEARGRRVSRRRPAGSLRLPSVGVRPAASGDGGLGPAGEARAFLQPSRAAGPLRALARGRPVRRARRRSAAAHRLNFDTLNPPMTPPDPLPPAFLFPGQLAEFVGMGRDFYDSDLESRELFAMTSERCGLDLRKILFSGPPETLQENLAAQAGVYLVSTLAARALARNGITPPATAGYSLGNYAALAAAGAISYEDGLDVLIAVWRETERLGIRGAMGAVVGARREAVDAVCEDLRSRGLPVWIGNVNSNTQFVLTGSKPAVESALQAL